MKFYLLINSKVGLNPNEKIIIKKIIMLNKHKTKLSTLAISKPSKNNMNLDELIHTNSPSVILKQARESLKISDNLKTMPPLPKKRILTLSCFCFFSCLMSDSIPDYVSPLLRPKTHPEKGLLDDNDHITLSRTRSK